MVRKMQNLSNGAEGYLQRFRSAKKQKIRKRFASTFHPLFL